MASRAPSASAIRSESSCLYEGEIRHRRFGKPGNEFRYRVFLACLDLAELDSVFRGRWLWSTRRPNIAWFRRADYLGDPKTPLDKAVRDRVFAETGFRPEGPIRLLTHLRYFGHNFNPVSFYYCYAADGETLDTIVAEIENTPWNERHAYVLPVRTAFDPEPRLRFRFPKQFHVSPFFPMEQLYDWRFTQPGRSLSIHMENFENGGKCFDATLTLERREIGAAALAGALARFPLITVKVIVAIYWQALRLWWKGARFHPHPGPAAKGFPNAH